MPYITISTIPTGDTLELQRGDTLTVTATRLGDISGRDSLWFTVKDDTADADILAQIQIEETAGSMTSRIWRAWSLLPGCAVGLLSLAMWGGQRANELHGELQRRQ